MRMDFEELFEGVRVDWVFRYVCENGKPGRVVVYYLGWYGRAHVNKLVGEGYCPTGYVHEPHDGFGYLRLREGGREEERGEYERLQRVLVENGFQQSREKGRECCYYHVGCRGGCF